MPDGMTDSVFAWADPGRIEELLCAKLARFLDFNGHALYFGNTTEAEYIAEERRLLLPVGKAGSGGAILRLDEVGAESLAAVLPHLAQLVALCLENTALTLARQYEPESGLHTEEALLALVCAKMEAMGSQTALPQENCLGFVVIDRPELPEADADETVFSLRLAAAFRAALPPGAAGARLGLAEGKNEIGALFAATGRGACQRLALGLLDALNRVPQKNGITRFCAGHVLYPQDFTGRELLLPPRKQASLMRARARLAASTARRTGHIRKPALAFGWLRVIGGQISAILPHGLARVSFGSNARIRIGQRFHVVGSDMPLNMAASKGQIIIRHVGETDALAQIFHIAAAGRRPEPGDGLILIQNQPDSGPAGPLLAHAEFLDKFGHARKGESRYALWIARFRPLNRPEAGAADENFRLRLGRMARAFFATRPDGEFAGWYGFDGMAGFLPGAGREQAADFAESLRAAAAKEGISCATGIFIYPFLNFGKQDSEAHALQALEYALLLPEPNIGFLDGVALAISADKRFSQGDELGALEEYRLALLLAPGNAEILNSLGVCLAALNRLADAREMFRQALNNSGDDDTKAKSCYNLGNLCQKENLLAEARDYYRRCIRIDPGHVYAWARLGQIHDRAGRPKGSRALYRHAARLAKDQPQALAMIQRQLARLETERNQTEKAREILHDSLLRNPADSASLLLLAKTYLEDEPAMAERLARECISLGGDGWQLLIDALKSLGRDEDAAKAERERTLHERI